MLALASPCLAFPSYTSHVYRYHSALGSRPQQNLFLIFIKIFSCALPDLSQAGGSGTTGAVMPFPDCSSAQPSPSAGAGGSWPSSQSLHTPSCWWLIAGAQKGLHFSSLLDQRGQSRKGEKAKVTDRAGDRESTWSSQWARPRGWGWRFES